MNYANRLQHTLAIVLLCVAGLVTQPAQAYHFPWDQGHDTTTPSDPDDPGPCSTPECDPCNSGASRSPVYAATGHCFWTDTDVVLRGRPHMAVTRTFNSNDPVDGLFGNGWTIDFDIALYPATNGTTQMRVFKAANGKRFEFIKQSDGSYLAPPSRFETITETASEVTMTTLDGTRYVFAPDGRLTTRLDPNGNRISISHDADGRPTQIYDDNGRQLAINYNAYSRIASITDHASRTWTYDYDSDGNLISVTDPMGGERKYEYRMYKPTGDGHTYTQLTRIVDASGVEVVQFTYNGTKVASYTEGANTFTYSRSSANTLVGGTVTRTDAMGARETFTYGEQGLVIQDKDALGYTTAYVYDDNGRLSQTTDALGRVWKRTYDDLGRMTSTTNPLGQTTTYVFNAFAPWPISMTTPSGRLTSLTYDASGNVLTIMDPAGAVTKMVYSNAGDIVTVTNALGQSVELETNSIGLVTQVTDALARVTTVTYDSLGRVITLTNAAGEREHYVYDELDRIVTIVDALDNTTHIHYDESGRISRITDPAGSTTTYVYDIFGRRSADVAPDGRRTTYNYRADNKLSKLTWPDGTSISYDYDANKRRTKEVAGSEQSTFAYNALGQLTKATGPGGVVNYTYDLAGRVRTENSNGKTTTVTRNAEGERIGLDYLDQALTYTRDVRGLATQISSGVGNFDFQFDPLGRRTNMAYPNGAKVSYGYDSVGQLNTLTHSGVFNAPFAYSFDAAGRITNISGNGPDWSYSYDKLGRLTNASHGAESYTYTLDEVANILEDERIYDENHRLVSDASNNYIYDQRGNLILEQNKISGARNTYSWNVKNQLIEVNYYDNQAASTPNRSLAFTYDPLGRRSSKSDNGYTQRFVYDGYNLIGTLDATGKLVTSNVFSGVVDEPLASFEGNTVRILYSDYLGSIVAISEESALTHEYDYAPYGAIAAGSNSDSVAFRYTGREMDSDGLFYYRARYYKPNVGRFISADPIGLEGGLNTYAYAGANPINLSDPTGLYQMCHRDLLLPIPYARHCYMKFDDGSTSSYDPSGVNKDPDPNQKGTVCTPSQDKEKDDCIKKAMQNCKGDDYSFTRFNCCHCAEQAMKQCGASLPQKDWPNWPVNPGPQMGEPGYSPSPVYGPDLGK